MSMRLLLTATLALSLLGGCRHDPHLQLYIDNVNAEKRLLEDTLYDLQYDYECKIQEVDKLRSELRQVKSGDAPAGTGRKPVPPSSLGEKLLRDIPELEPPTVEPGIPTSPTAPDTQPPQKPDDLDDLDDLEPPVLDLGEEESDVSNVPQPALEQAQSGPRPAAGRTGKVATRWTPRAERPQEPPASRLRVADRPDPSSAQPMASEAAPAAGAGPATQQAQRPQWRPYR
ncbi:MAG: hypothetical protein GXY58_00680 [Planctomycetaceae bacterium]|nr:hypothetical protein [Planctomycetaceae bacterium]